MLNKLYMKIMLIVIVLLLYGLSAQSQNQKKTLTEPQTLSALLNQVMVKSNIRFAFDNDLFSKIETSISYNRISLQDFLKEICFSYGLNFKIISGTYVFFVDNQVKFTEAVKAQPTLKNIEELQVQIPPAKECELTGIVRNIVTGEKLKNCNLNFNDNKSAQTNEMGYFSKNLITGNDIRISINHVGFKQFDTIFTVESTMPIEIRLRPIYIQVQSMKTLHTGKFFLEIPDVSELVAINPKSVIYIPGVESNDFANALTILPGINFLRGTNTGISIRGGNPSENLVLIDGIPIVETSHLMGNLSVLNSKFLNEAYVSRGGFGAEYGESTAGIVDLTGKTGSGQVSVVDFTANILNANLYVGLPINEKSSLSGAFRKSLFDVWPNKFLESLPFEKVDLNIDNQKSVGGNVLNTTINYYDANLKLSIRPSSRKEISINYINSYDSQQRNYQFLPDNPFFQNDQSSYHTTGYGINWKFQRVNNWMNSYSISYNQLTSSSHKEYGKQEEKFGLRPRNSNDDYKNSLQEIRAGWKSEYKTKRFTHQFGLGYNNNKLSYNYRIYEEMLPGIKLKPEDSISIDTGIAQFNGYYQTKIELAKWLKIRGGIRSVFDIETNTVNYQPRYGIEVFPFRILKLSYSGGNYKQNLYRTYRIDSDRNVSNIWYIPPIKNSGLNATHNIAGLRLDVKGLLVNIEAYQKNNSGKSYFIANKMIVDGEELVEYDRRQGAEINRGIDFFLQFQHHIFKHLISYSYAESKEMIEGVNNGDFFDSFDDQLQRLRLSEIISLKGWTVSCNWFFANGNPYLLRNSTSSQFNFLRFPDFSQFDVSLIKQFRFKNLNTDIGMTFLNVLNHRNEVGIEYYDIIGELSSHSLQSTITSTYYTPLFFINIRYE